ncbi:P-loop containing nucleoside triphosphate hydrolase protein [Mytilinidion resinicola]|uniref:P-loop containing nucleoside triphosphate hydrolase protein n=1 Tax=Mytilinidion resinicola TaxID=574789 RepID=A0A6A6YZ26_9PEZI|nr:P-loop containing nucleoside triphosphate hydrolase protein [Mytilinidion resinicola]KAF2813185.1 P-loop containing nucleoside triphosphate hydrolase protein [Mytilinidion resinicola]
MASAVPTDVSGRSAKLLKYFLQAIHGKRAIQTASDGQRFFEALGDQKDRLNCVEKLIAADHGLRVLKESLRFDVSRPFLIGPATDLLLYFSEPALRQLCSGQFLLRILEVIADPPTFWNALVKAHKERVLTENATEAFAWLLLELLSARTDGLLDVRDIAEDVTKNKSLLDSPSIEVRKYGQKLKHVLQTTASNAPYGGAAGPGGRHDNDFVDFRQVAILPTPDELFSTEKPFYRQADAIKSAEADSRGAMHLDNQFRLLREDMLGELRTDLQIAQGRKNGKRRSAIVRGLYLTSLDCGTAQRRKPCSMVLRCIEDIPQLSKIESPTDRLKYVRNEYKFLKHQSFGSLMVGKELVAFATLERDENLLAQKPPSIVLRLSSEAAFTKALLVAKSGHLLDFVLVDTAVFAYEPVLKCLQTKTQIPMQEELLQMDINESLPESEVQPKRIVELIRQNSQQDMRKVIGTPKDIKLDASQAKSLISGLTRRVCLIQGPPGTGKSFIGALLAKILLDHTKEIILVITYTNHALDQFLEDLLDIGISRDSMLRLGSKSTPRTMPMLLSEISKQRGSYRRTPVSWDIINALKLEAESYEILLAKKFKQYNDFKVGLSELLEHLEFSDDDSRFFDAFTVPSSQDGMTHVGKKNKTIDGTYLLDQWRAGKGPGLSFHQIFNEFPEVWKMDKPSRDACMSRWRMELLKDLAAEIQTLMTKYDRCMGQVNQLFEEKNAAIIKSKRVIGCTTTAAAKYTKEIGNASPGIIIVEEAGEILESHVLTAMTPNSKQLILIGDHKQLRPKVNNYALTVEKGDDYNLNQSLFERLVLSGANHETLSLQHRMCPEISSLVRQMTYPELEDAPKTQNRPPLKGFQDRVMFITHDYPELNAGRIAERRDEGSQVSKENIYEVDMVLRCVRYLGQQGYGTGDIVVLTPYLGQLQLLRTKLGEENDPILNDLDSYDLVRAGLLPPASAGVSKRTIKISTIDNYQGEESDIVISTLTRSNASGEIGFMSSPQRVNVLLSRARNALIMIGNSNTFMRSRKGKDVWEPLLNHLKHGGHVFDGFPVKCERHPDRKALLRSKEDFDAECPDGGCSEPCGTKLNCSVHDCPQRCHQLQDHSKVDCKAIVKYTCSQNHNTSLPCYKQKTATCRKCDEIARAQEKKRRRDHKLDVERENKQKAYAKELADIQEEIEHQRRIAKDQSDDQERQKVILQHKQDLLNMTAANRQTRTSVRTDPSSVISGSKHDKTDQKTNAEPPSQPSQPSGTATGTPIAAQNTNGAAKTSSPLAKDVWQPPPSTVDWEYQKKFEGARNDALDALTGMIGLEDVKQQFLSIKAKVDVTTRQGVPLKTERFGAALLGNPGTGKTTVARLYAKFLASVGALPSDFFFETSGSALANDGVSGCKKHLESILNSGGGAFFIDEAYQLVSGNSPGGKAVLDYLLAEIENLTGKVVFVLAGYNKQMEAFFAHNPGIPSRIPQQFQFQDYEDSELLLILRHAIETKYNRKMKVELGMDGLYFRIVARRLGRGRGREGFGNARAVHNKLAQIADRQATRLKRERRAGKRPDDNLLTKEDMLGPHPSDALQSNASWSALQNLTGLKAVKESVRVFVNTIQFNYRRELEEKEIVEYSLNKVFLGSPGTGKTTVAKLYGQILADIGLLSNGEVVVKNPADFIGNVIGQSESNTKGILASTVGKVLVIDEAYMLSGGSDNNRSADSFKTAVIDTIVAEVQSTAGEDRCVLLLGYKDQMEEMFQKVNPGLTRRFPLDSAFVFEDFSDVELEKIFESKLHTQGFEATDQAKRVAMDILRRARNRPHFGNAGEVDILLDKAKAFHQKHILAGTSKHFDKLEALDFDEDFNRGQRATTNCRKLFEGTIGCDAIVQQLEGYQTTAANMKALDMDPREQIPFNFLFRGPPGTGKTSTARRMGKVYYDMGFLSTAEVVECSATELVGQYVGHTGPKTQKLLEKALGKVLFIDEAYRLAEGDFATEAMDELVDSLTKPKFAQKLVTILAGYDADINRLMSINPGLTSRFPEAIVFHHLTPGQCLQLFGDVLKKKKLNTTVLEPPSDALHQRLLDSFKVLSKLPAWGNARDVQTLAKTVFSTIMSTATTPSLDVPITEQNILGAVQSMISERSHRSTATSTSRHPVRNAPLPTQSMNPPDIPVNTDTATSNNTALPPAPPAPQKQQPGAKSQEEPQPDDTRDAGVSDAIWTQLSHDKAVAATLALEEQRLQAEAAAQQKAAADDLKRAEAELAALAAAAAADAEAQRAHEAMRLKRELERRAREERLAALERQRREAEERRKREEVVQQKLRHMGVCVMGYRWIKQASGYRCAGGGHFVSDQALG